MSSPDPGRGEQARQAQQDQPLVERSAESKTKPGDVVPHVGRPLDGSEYLDVVEEQVYSGRLPARDGKNEEDEHPQDDSEQDPPSIAVGGD